MVKKATIDTLEIEENSHVPTKQEPTGADGETKHPVRFNPLWLWTAGGILVVFCSTMLISYLWMTRKQARHAVRPQTTAPVRSSAEIPRRMVQLNDFFITFTQNRGRKQVMICDLTFELNKDGQKEKFRQRLFAIRSVLYEEMEKKNPRDFFNPERRENVKREIIALVSGMLGGHIVKGVYFTRLFVL